MSGADAEKRREECEKKAAGSAVKGIGGVGIVSYEEFHKNGKQNAGYYINENGQWESFDLPSDFIDHMVLIAPMAAFEGETLFTSIMDICGEDILENLASREHYGRRDIIRAGVEECPFFASTIIRTLQRLPEGYNIAHNYWSDITQDVLDTTEDNPYLSDINELMLIRGEFGGINDDGVIPDEDINSIYSNSNANEKYKARVFGAHSGMQNFPGTYDPLISKFLNDQEFTSLEKYWRDIEIEG